MKQGIVRLGYCEVDWVLSRHRDAYESAYTCCFSFIFVAGHWWQLAPPMKQIVQGHILPLFWCNEPL
jgi:hypothetical protein